MIDVKKIAEQAGLRTGDNLKFEDGYRYRSLGAPRNVKEQHLHQFAALVLEEAALEFDRRNVNAADGGPSEGWYEATEPAEIIRAMKPQIEQQDWVAMDKKAAILRLYEEMEKHEEKERARKAALPAGVCKECEGEGEQGGQFSGYWTCESCNGSGKESA